MDVVTCLQEDVIVPIIYTFLPIAVTVYESWVQYGKIEAYQVEVVLEDVVNGSRHQSVQKGRVRDDL